MLVVKLVNELTRGALIVRPKLLRLQRGLKWAKGGQMLFERLSPVPANISFNAGVLDHDHFGRPCSS